MLTKIHCIKIIIWKQICYSSPYEAHLKNQRVAFAKKEKDAMNSQKVIFSKITETTQRTSAKGRPIQNTQQLIISISMACYVHTTDVLAFNCPCRTLCLGNEQFLWFLKSGPLAISPHFTPFLLKQMGCFLCACLIRSTIANLCPNIIKLMLWIY